ncbi:MAG: hypothetical protein JW740_01185 [Candidatus Zambryskibacteria bacterium]|nr:hypothetical protein [Candidatus Zambryskibacteria bacterium]
MKKINGILWLILTAAFLSGCGMARVEVNGVPQVGVEGGFFPPNNTIIVTNNTGAPVSVTIYEPRHKTQKVSLKSGEQAKFPFRSFFRSEAVVIVSLHDPETGAVLDSKDRSFYLTDNGGNPQVHTWTVRSRSSQNLIW